MKSDISTLRGKTIHIKRFYMISIVYTYQIVDDYVKIHLK